ncbi:DUF1177 family protein [Falsiroseomonas oryzae]|uniref:DUF1177 family protein n=1 Tax=Falsiroseomonas oryzae TaxID=2766473 RepID=UPI0022EA4780|nr:DUF1177 family protein [Roseomonas sp. MO-31]
MLKEILDVLDFMTAPRASVEDFLRMLPPGAHSHTTEVVEVDGRRMDFLKILFPGRRGRSAGGNTRTLGVIGSLGALRVPGDNQALVSDADGCLVALAVALRLARMAAKGQVLASDVLISTQLCHDGRAEPHDPYPFVMSPIPSRLKHPRLVDPRMDGLVVVETCKSNKLVSHKGFAITHVAKEGMLLRLHANLIHIQEMVTGRLPVIFPVSQQDLTPYETGIHHVCGMMLPALYTDAPVLGVPMVTEAQTWPAWTNVQHASEMDQAGRFCLEVATRFGLGECEFFYEADYEAMKKFYGTLPRAVAPA